MDHGGSDLKFQVGDDGGLKICAAGREAVKSDRQSRKQISAGCVRLGNRFNSGCLVRGDDASVRDSSSRGIRYGAAQHGSRLREGSAAQSTQQCSKQKETKE